jgi:leader peptidase (prepilin peptidase)/N-methyltransferase
MPLAAAPASPLAVADLLLLGAASGALITQLWLIARTDLARQRIPDGLNLVLLASGLLVSLALSLDLGARLMGIAAGYGALAGLAFAYRQLRGRDGLGLGDAKLLGAGGAWIGVMGLPFATLLAASLGLVFVAVQRLRGRALSPTDRLAFGPFLGAGIAIVWLVQRFGGPAGS